MDVDDPVLESMFATHRAKILEIRKALLSALEGKERRLQRLLRSLYRACNRSDAGRDGWLPSDHVVKVLGDVLALPQAQGAALVDAVSYGWTNDPHALSPRATEFQGHVNWVKRVDALQGPAVE